jgi:hypothetical protein
MTEAQLERVVEYYQVRSFAVILTEADTVRQNEAQELLNNIYSLLKQTKMKKLQNTVIAIENIAKKNPNGFTVDHNLC